jgi:hypothetical protein
MRKLIDIKGDTKQKNSVAWKLLQKASKEGKDLKNFIQDELEKIAESKL